MRFIPVLILAGCALAARASDDFTPLYNGKDLSGWHVKDGQAELWQAKGEILFCGKGAIGAGGWLTTDREYGDFVLRLEWKIPKNGNSGVGLRYPKEGEPAHEGMEIQILDDASPENVQRPPEELSGGLFAEAGVQHKADKPVGEWNAMEITCRGTLLVVRTNGIETLRLNLADLTVLRSHHRQYQPVSGRPRKGFLGLQGDRGVPVEFRHILIKEL